MAAALGASLLVAPAAASEPTPKVTVKKIASKKAAYGKSVTITPNVSKAGKVKISSKLLTVKKGSTTVASKKTSVKLKAGTYKVTTTVKYKVGTKKNATTWVYGSTKTKTLTQTLKITQSAKPTRVAGIGWDCPSGYPIKGNASSMIYHVPSGSYYSRTKPEECFATESAARNAGYRKSQR